MKAIAGDHQLCARTDALFSNDSKKSYRPALFHFFNTSRLSCYNSRLMSMLSQDFTNCLELTNVFFVMLKHFGQLSKRLPRGQRKQLEAILENHSWLQQYKAQQFNYLYWSPYSSFDDSFENLVVAIYIL